MCGNLSCFHYLSTRCFLPLVFTLRMLWEDELLILALSHWLGRPLPDKPTLSRETTRVCSLLQTPMAAHAPFLPPLLSVWATTSTIPLEDERQKCCQRNVFPQGSTDNTLCHCRVPTSVALLPCQHPERDYRSLKYVQMHGRERKYNYFKCVGPL